MFYSVCIGPKGDENIAKTFYHPENAIEFALDYLTKQKNFRMNKYQLKDLYKKKKIVIGEFNVDYSHNVFIGAL